MKFLLSAGTAYSASTPLYYTLALDQKYCHAGAHKENEYLKLLSVPVGAPDYCSLEEFIKYRRLEESPNHEWVKMVDNSIALDDDIYEPPYTLDRYVEYYRRLYDKVHPEFEAVADFSNYNFKLKEDFLIQLRDKLSKYFEVKVIMVLRDPISRAFSEQMAWTKHFKKKIVQKLSPAGNPPVTGYLGRLQYVQAIQRYDRVFGRENVLPLVMEEFWNDPDSPERLSGFLEYPITHIHENAYVPDKGSNAPLYKGLSDQARDQEDMTQELYDWCLQYFGFVYDEWEEYYGSLPIYWKKVRQGL